MNCPRVRELVLFFALVAGALGLASAPAYAADIPVTLAAAAGQPATVAAGAVNFTASFATPVTGLVPGDVTLLLSPRAGSTLTGGTVAITPVSTTEYTISVSGLAGEGTVSVSLAAGAVDDGVGNTNAAAGPVAVGFDSVVPTVSVTLAPSQAAVASGAPLQFVATFSEAVTGFTEDDVTVGTSTRVGGTALTGGTASVAVVGSNSYSVTVSGVAGEGTVTVSVVAAAALDVAGNSNSPGAVAIGFDSVAPTVTLSAPPGVSTSGTVAFTATFSEDVTGFTASDVALGLTGLTGGSVGVTGGPRVYAVTVAGLAGEGSAMATIAAGSVADVASNSNPLISSASAAVDTVVPAATIVASAGQPPIVASGSVSYTVTFSTAVSGFTPADLAVVFTNAVGGTPLTGGAITLTGGPTVYTASVNAIAGEGAVQLQLLANAVSDSAGNMNEAGLSTPVVFDSVRPSVIVNGAPTQADPTGALPIRFTAEFSEDVSGFTANDVVVSGTAGASDVTVTGSGRNYTIEVTGPNGPGTVTLSIVAAAAFDIAGNTSNGSTSADNTVTFIGTSFVSLVPGRLLESRVGAGATVDRLFAGVGLRGAGSVTELVVAGRGGVPVSASAVVLNVTVTDARGGGFVSVWPCGGAVPLASSLNYAVGATVANAVVSRVGVDRKVCIFAESATHLIVDVNGYFV